MIKKAKVPKRIVVDASVAKAAGGVSEHPLPSACRRFLEAMRDGDHRLVMTSELRKEWDRHETVFARQWRAAMVSRKRLEVVRDSESAGIRDFLEQHEPLSDKDRAAMRKDVHLMEGALLTDRRIVSLDDTARALFSALPIAKEWTQGCMWANPGRHSALGEWLAEGAPPTAAYLLYP